MSRPLLCIILLAATAVAAAESAGDKERSLSGAMSYPMWLQRLVSDGRVLARGSASARAVSPPPPVTVNGAACEDPPATVVLDPGIAKRFRTPAYPSDYPNGASCGWEFVAYNGRPLDMHCDSVSLAPNDFFNFYDVTSGVQRSINDVSGASISESFSGDRVEASFESDASGTAEGFQTQCVIWSSTSDSFSMVNDPPTSSTSTPTTTTTTQPPTSSTTTPAAPACQCGDKFGSRIVGGQPATPDEYPWMVSIGVGKKDQFCGGTLISDRWIVTAAHCIDILNVIFAWTIEVGLGCYYRLSSPSSSSITRTAKEIIRHPNYDGTTLENDIALIRVDPIDWAQNPKIRPACLPDNSEHLYSGSTGIITGWGKTSSGNSSDRLMEVSIPIISNSECEEYLSQTIPSSMMCAGEEDGGVDSCQGDSGGPMVVMDGPNAELVGVVSWGYGCAEPRSPGVYARVTEFLPWIQTSTSGSEYCPRS